MRWQNRQGSKNVEDRRGMGRAGAGIGIGGIIVVIIALLMGENPLQFLQQVQTQAPVENTQPGAQPDDELGQFVSVVLKETENTWNTVFQQHLNQRYQEPVLVIFDQVVQSACGMAQSATGPFYCPGDNKLYIDLSFYRELKERFQAPGDFAMAYVIAHEVGHHVQNLLGITDEMARQRGRISQAQYNQLSVRLELQADYLAGVWAHYANRAQLLEEGDIQEALQAANAIGDDRIQRQSSGRVVPESFTHGTSEQRMRWFMKGYKAGDLSQGDTFNATSL